MSPASRTTGMKRSLDLIISTISLLLAGPILLLIAGLIALRRDGDILFRQKRIGLNRRPFTIYKFRTMRQRDPDKIDQLKEAVIASGKDARITSLGRFLRATSLDELPQLFNILNGTMSVVGPRPMIPEQLLAIPEDKTTRFNVKPGVTGWAQVNGRRGLSWPDQLELDAWYAEHASFLLDLKILLKTPFVVFKASGVYNDASANWRNYLPNETTGQDASPK